MYKNKPLFYGIKPLLVHFSNVFKHKRITDMRAHFFHQTNVTFAHASSRCQELFSIQGFGRICSCPRNYGQAAFFGHPTVAAQQVFHNNWKQSDAAKTHQICLPKERGMSSEPVTHPRCTWGDLDASCIPRAAHNPFPLYHGEFEHAENKTNKKGHHKLCSASLSIFEIAKRTNISFVFYSRVNSRIIIMRHKDWGV